MIPEVRRVLKRLHNPLEMKQERGDTMDFLLTAKRDLAAARRYLERAMNLHDLPEKITIDKCGANTVANRSINDDACIHVELRQSKFLNKFVEQVQRAVK